MSEGGGEWRPAEVPAPGPGKRTIGILGGMGPEATILLMQRILEGTPAPAGRDRDDADHVPLLVDNNTQVPSRIRHLIEGTGEDPAPTLAAMVRRLEAAGAEALAMPCNTAHSYASAIRDAATVPFLDMVGLTAAAVDSERPAAAVDKSMTAAAVGGALTAAAVGGRPGGEVSGDRHAGAAGILASPAVEATGIFAEAFAARGRAVLYPADRAAMLAAIRAVKAGRMDEARPVLAAAAGELAAAGAAVLVVGCSEFSLLSRTLAAPVPVIDTLDVLAEAVVRFSLAPEPAPA